MNMTIAKLIAEATEVQQGVTPGDWRPGTVRPAVEVYCSHPEGLAGPADERLLLRLNEHFPSVADARFIARSRSLVPELVAALQGVCAQAEELEQELGCWTDATGTDQHDLAARHRDEQATLVQDLRRQLRLVEDELRVARAAIAALKYEHEGSLAWLKKAHEENIRQRGLADVVSRSEFDQLRETLNGTLQELDTLRAQARVVAQREEATNRLNDLLEQAQHRNHAQSQMLARYETAHGHQYQQLIRAGLVSLRLLGLAEDQIIAEARRLARYETDPPNYFALVTQKPYELAGNRGFAGEATQAPKRSARDPRFNNAADNDLPQPARGTNGLCDLRKLPPGAVCLARGPIQTIGKRTIAAGERFTIRHSDDGSGWPVSVEWSNDVSFIRSHQNIEIISRQDVEIIERGQEHDPR